MSLTNGTQIFRPFQLELKKRKMSEDFHLLWKLSTGMNRTI